MYFINLFFVKYPSVTPVFEFKNVKGVLDLDLDK